MKNSILVNADLRRADLSGTDLTGSDLRGANCRYVDARGASLRNTNLVNAYFYQANLAGADLRGALLVLSPADDARESPGETIRENEDSSYHAHFRNADFTGTAVSIKWKDFLQGENVKNFDRIIWAR
jgi:uncharacterized protein YjbI with pentapeptide repeats